MHILLATDADWVVDEVSAAVGGADTTIVVCRDGRDVSPYVSKRAPDVAVLDLQSGSMGGMAVAMDLRLDESGGRIPRVPIVLLLDRDADIPLARRSGADGWLVKPLDPIRLNKAISDVAKGLSYSEAFSG